MAGAPLPSESASTDRYERQEEPPSVEAFVLDRVENPHPKMLEQARRRRLAAIQTRGFPNETSAHVRGEWAGYLDAMCDATGETPEAIEAWMNRA